MPTRCRDEGLFCYGDAFREFCQTLWASTCSHTNLQLLSFGFQVIQWCYVPICRKTKQPFSYLCFDFFLLSSVDFQKERPIQPIDFFFPVQSSIPRFRHLSRCYIQPLIVLRQFFLSFCGTTLHAVVSGLPINHAVSIECKVSEPSDANAISFAPGSF